MEGICLIAIDVGKLQPGDEFKAVVDDLARSLKAVEPAQGFGAVIVPGQREAETEKSYEKDGVPLRDEDWTGLVKTDRQLAVDLDNLTVSCV